MSETTYTGMSSEGSRWPDDEARPAVTIPELSVELRAIRDEFRRYVERHDRERAEALVRIERDLADIRTDVERDIATIRTDVRLNTEWRHRREAQETIFRWLIGSNVGVLVAVLGLVLVGLAVVGSAP